MRLRRLKLQNFRNHADSGINFGDAAFIVIRGLNFAGKSTIGQAISICLTLTTTGLDDFTAKIKRGASKAVIAVEVQGKRYLVERTVTLNTNTSGRSQRSFCLNDPNWDAANFDKQLKANHEALLVCLNTDAFIAMNAGEQKNLLAGLALPTHYEFDREKIAEVESVLGLNAVSFDGRPLEVINTAYRKLYDERTIVNRQVRDFVMPEDPEAARERISKLEWKGILPDDRLAALRKVAAGKDELDRLSKEKAQIERELREVKGEAKRLEEIPEAGTKCPTCDQRIDPERLRQMAADLAVSIRALEEQTGLLSQKIQALGGVEPALREIALHEAAVKQRAEVQRVSAEEREKEIAIKREQYRALKEKAALLDALVKYFDKDGIKAKLLKEYIGGFEHKVNEVLGAWGYACALKMEPYSFMVTNAEGDTNPLGELSGAERVMFSLAFQCAVARTANIGMVVIDEVAMFLPEQRPVLNKKLYEMVTEGWLEQVILLVADSSEEAPSLPGTAFYMVERGAVHELAKGA